MDWDIARWMVMLELESIVDDSSHLDRIPIKHRLNSIGVLIDTKDAALLWAWDIPGSCWDIPTAGRKGQEVIGGAFGFGLNFTSTKDGVGKWGYLVDHHFDDRAVLLLQEENFFVHYSGNP
jgi:hypothetical protein